MMFFEHKEYLDFIESCKSEKFTGKGEVHHIRPKSYGGSNDSNNLILLSFKNHLHAHYILWKLETEYSKPGPMTKAFAIMMGKYNDEKYSKEYHGEIYEQLRLDFSLAQSLTLKGRKQSKEHIEKRIVRGENHPFFGREYTKEEKENLRIKSSKPKSESTKERMRLAQQKRSKEISEQVKGSNNPNANKSIYIFVHPKFGIEIKSPFLLKEKYSITGTKINALAKRNFGSYHGWSMVNFDGKSYDVLNNKYENDETKELDLFQICDLVSKEFQSLAR
jgi:HNH endonuclease/NUMOD3 motif